MRYPLMFPIISFLIGILSIDKIRLFFTLPKFMPVILALLVLLIFSLILLRNKVRFFFFSVCLFFFLLGIFRYATVMSPLENDVGKFISVTPQKCLACGTIISEPEWRGPFYDRRLVFIFKIERLLIDREERKVSGNIYVKLSQKQEQLFIGDSLILSGKIYTPFDKKTTTGFNYKKFLNQKSIYAVMSGSCKDYYLRTGVNQNILLLGRRFVSRIRHKARDAIDKYLSGYTKSITEAVILGFRDDIKPEINDIFIKTGTMHILSVSGLHVGIVVVCLMLVLRLVWCPEKVKYLLTIVGICGYSIFTGCQIPAIRASLMGSCVIFNMLLGRRIDTINALGLSAFLILFFQPAQLFMPSFVLSYIAVLSIIYLMPITNQFLGVINCKNNVKRYFVKSISLSLSVWIGVSPLIALYFCIVSFSVILANLLAVPVFFMVVILGFILLLVSSFNLLLPISNLIAGILNIVIFNFINVMENLSKVPFSSINVSPLNWIFVILFYAVLVAGILLFHRKKTRRD